MSRITGSQRDAPGVVMDVRPLLPSYRAIFTDTTVPSSRKLFHSSSTVKLV